jgi:hypothetical protein
MWGLTGIGAPCKKSAFTKQEGQDVHSTLMTESDCGLDEFDKLRMQVVPPIFLLPFPIDVTPRPYSLGTGISENPAANILNCRAAVSGSRLSSP